MYIEDISAQLNVFLYSVGFGFLLGLLYDILKIIRVLIIKSNRAVIIQDVVYFLLCSLLTFLFLLVVNNGKFRFNVFVALAFGFFVYYLTLGRFSVGFVVSIAGKCKKTLNTVARIITLPYRFIMVTFGKLHLKLPEKLKNIKISQKKAKKTLENKE